MAAVKRTKSDAEFRAWLQNFIDYYTTLSDEECNLTIDCMIACSASSQLRHLHSQTSMLLHRDFLRLLPEELREHIFSYLDEKALINCCSVSKTWNGIINNSARIWQQACERTGLVVNKNINNSDAKYWKGFFLDMLRRKHDMKTYKSFLRTTYERNLRRVTAVYYYKGKVATASDSKIIQIWDCQKDICLLTIRTDASISCIKFDDQVIIASSYLGHMVSWEVNTGQRMTEYMRHMGAIFTFDYSLDMNLIISGSADSLIKIWALHNGLLHKTINDHNRWVLKVLLSPYPVANDNDVYLLFSMDKACIVVRLMSFVAAEKGLYLTTLYSIKPQSHLSPGLRSEKTFAFVQGLHFDGEFLYFAEEDAESHVPRSVLCKLDVKKGQMASAENLKFKMKALLGVGKKFFVVLLPWHHKAVPNFVVLDRKSREHVAVWNLPPSKFSSPDCSQLCLGEKGWLDGLDGKNDTGVLLSAAMYDNCVSVVKWTERTPAVT